MENKISQEENSWKDGKLVKIVEGTIESLKRRTGIDYTNLHGTFYKCVWVRNLSASEVYRALLEVQEDKIRFGRYGKLGYLLTAIGWLVPPMLGFGTMAAYENLTGHKVPAEVGIPATFGTFGAMGLLFAANLWFAGRTGESGGKLERLEKNLQQRLGAQI